MFKNLQFEENPAVPFNHSTLLAMLKGYRRPNDKISRMLSQGELRKIKRGLYVFGKLDKATPISQPLIANLLYGPSYVSLDYALSHYGIIPEAVFEISSMTTGRAKTFDTPFGRFNYTHSYSSLYPVGIQIHKNSDGSCFLLASVEKALCDKIIFTKKLRLSSVKSVMAFLIEDLRIERSSLSELDIGIVKQCFSAGYKKNQLSFFIKLLETL